MNTTSELVTNRRTSAGPVRGFGILNGLVLLGVLLQGVWAGEFMGQMGGPDWVGLHQTRIRE
jgi:hypothetical protein